MLPRPTTRRGLLHAGGATLGVVVSGCLGVAPGDHPTATSSSSPAGDPISVNETIHDESIEYLESNHSVRYVKAWRHANHEEVENGSAPPTRVPVYKSVPFDDWAETECLTVAAEAVRETVTTRLDEPPVGLSTGVGILPDAGRLGVWITIETYVYGAEGRTPITPSVTADRIERLAPSTVDVTISFHGHPHSCTVPVIVREATLRYGSG